MDVDRDIEITRAEAFLSPLAKSSPATRHRRAPLRVRRLVFAVLAIAILLAGAAVAATEVFGPLHDATVTPIAGPLTCSGVVGEPANDAASYLEAHGYQVSWRFETYGDHTLSAPDGSQPGAVAGGYSQRVASPPEGSVVSDILSTDGPNNVIVLTQAQDDPNAPQIVPPECANKR